MRLFEHEFAAVLSHSADLNGQWWRRCHSQSLHQRWPVQRAKPGIPYVGNAVGSSCGFCETPILMICRLSLCCPGQALYPNLVATPAFLVTRFESNKRSSYVRRTVSTDASVAHFWNCAAGVRTEETS